MSGFGEFQNSREQYLGSLQDKREDVLGLEQIEQQNVQLEEENGDLQRQIEIAEQDISRTPEGRRILGSYLLRTPLGILYEAVKAIRKEPEKQRSLLEAVAEIERFRLESDYDVEIVEPGEIAADIIRTVSSELEHEIYMSDPEAKAITDEAIKKLEGLGNMSPMDIRTVSRIFKVIPKEHLSASIRTIEKTPVREVLFILQELSKELARITDKEMVDKVVAVRRELEEDRGDTAAYIRPWNKEVVFSQKVSSIFAWTLAHEVGHGVYRNILKRDRVETWESISKKALTLYGEHMDEGHQASENFSEMYALYLLNKPLFKILSIFDADFRNQYKYFKDIMPERTSNLPKTAGILYPLMDKGSRWFMQLIEKVTKLPFYESEKQSLKYTYDKEKRFESTQQFAESIEKRLEKLIYKIREIFFGSTSPESIQYEKDFTAYKKGWGKFIQNDIAELHQNRKIIRLLIESGLIEEAYEASRPTHINNKSLRQLTSGSTSILMAAYELVVLQKNDEEFIERARYATSIFLEDYVRIISNEGERRFAYKPEYQERIDDLLAEYDLENVVPITYEIQMDGMRALKHPSESDAREIRRLIGKYNMDFKNTEDRGFSEAALKRLEEAIGEFPPDDSKLLGGFMRLSEAKPENILKTLFQLGRSKKTLVPVPDSLLALPKNEMQSQIAAYVAQEILQSNRQLAQEFIKVGGWQAAKPSLYARALTKFFSKQNPYLLFHKNDSNPDSFLTQVSRANMQWDFQTCYQWFLLYRQEFQELAATNPVLRAKYELFERYFSK